MEQNKQSSGNFLSGLVTGLSLGALISYFSTASGKKTWKKLGKKWEKARFDLYKEGLIDDPHLTLDEVKNKYFSAFKQSLWEFKDNMSLALLKLEKEKNKEKARKSSWRNKKKNQFKGI